MSQDHDLSRGRANWDARAPLHAASADYALDAAVADPGRISPVVRFDRPRLGDIAGLDVVHLQCHIGTDTLSLHRLGARVAGLDFSAASIAEARRLAQRAGADIDYVVSDVFDAPTAFGERRFDLVYTGIGALVWLPSIARWADAVAGVLRPGGRLFVREMHPVLWTTGDDDDAVVLRLPYFEQPEPAVWDDAGTYVAVDGPVSASVTHEWNHGIGEIVTALLERGFRITGLVEHDSVPWMALPQLMTWDDELGDDRSHARLPGPLRGHRTAHGRCNRGGIRGTRPDDLSAGRTSPGPSDERVTRGGRRGRAGRSGRSASRGS